MARSYAFSNQNVYGFYVSGEDICAIDEFTRDECCSPPASSDIFPHRIITPAELSTMPRAEDERD